MTREQFEHAVRAAGAVLEAGLVDPDRLQERFAEVGDLSKPVRQKVEARIERA